MRARIATIYVLALTENTVKFGMRTVNQLCEYQPLLERQRYDLTARRKALEMRAPILFEELCMFEEMLRYTVQFLPCLPLADAHLGTEMADITLDTFHLHENYSLQG